MATNLEFINLTSGATIADLITADPKTSQLLESIGMEPLAHKDETLRSVCQQLKWSEDEVMKGVRKNRTRKNAPIERESNLPDSSLNLTEWYDYLVNEYDPLVLTHLADVVRDFQRVHHIHGNQYIGLKRIQWPLMSFKEKLRIYAFFEKGKLFPLAKQIMGGRGEIKDKTVQNIKRGVEIIEEDQNAMRKLMNTIERKGQKFRNPAGVCVTLRMFNYNLKSLFSEVRQRFDIEREIIIPSINERLSSI